MRDFPSLDRSALSFGRGNGGFGGWLKALGFRSEASCLGRQGNGSMWFSDKWGAGSKFGRDRWWCGAGPTSWRGGLCGGDLVLGGGVWWRSGFWIRPGLVLFIGLNQLEEWGWAAPWSVILQEFGGTFIPYGLNNIHFLFGTW
jgi:hypothetical protein